ncbi:MULTISPECIES: hypothetical protein [Bacteroides]|jgi:hypothetical protein|uniref:hypothetical protein n=1 Tax=Bacteroides TaxID=816 RepID=UPI001651C2E9|nr:MULTISPECIES: hypothetical protein [Bacteroides]
MRYKFLNLASHFPVFSGFVLGILLAGCNAGDAVLPDTAPDPEPGEPVTLTFDMYSASVTRADAASTSEDMAIGKIFRIYAFPAGSTNLGTPLDSKNYTVQPSEADASKPGKATGSLTLYRGTYDLYLVSYNSSTEVPELDSSGAFTVSNGKDFMYTKLEGIVVQPDKTGDNTMLVSLPKPFTRMGAQVITTVKARNSMQPVTPTALVVNYIKVSGLYGSYIYKLNNTSWETPTATTVADASYSFEKFDSNNTLDYDVTKERTSDPGVLLPVGGTQKMKFDVNLTVKYKDGSLTKTSTDSYFATIEKALLPGMTYQFDFSLTFYGAIVPSDLTLAIREWTTSNLTGEDLGKD